MLVTSDMTGVNGVLASTVCISSLWILSARLMLHDPCPLVQHSVRVLCGCSPTVTQREHLGSNVCGDHDDLPQPRLCGYRNYAAGQQHFRRRCTGERQLSGQAWRSKCTDEAIHSALACGARIDSCAK